MWRPDNTPSITARCNRAATLGTYTDEMETATATPETLAHRRAWRDD